MANHRNYGRQAAFGDQMEEIKGRAVVDHVLVTGGVKSGARYCSVLYF